MGRFVLAGADESEDLIAFSFWSLQADRSVIMNESKADLDPKRLLILQGVAVRQVGGLRKGDE